MEADPGIRTASMERRPSMKPKSMLQRMSFQATRSMSLSRAGSELDNVRIGDRSIRAVSVKYKPPLYSAAGGV